MMAGIDREAPGYGFSHNVGYGTPSHAAALRKLGPSAHHRLTWQPVAAVCGSEVVHDEMDVHARRGPRGGAFAQGQAGYRLIERNVRTRYGEIDLVAEDNGCLVFLRGPHGALC